MSDAASMDILSPQPLRVLLLEDSKFDAELLKEALRDSHPEAQLTWARDEDEFMQALGCGPFHLILSDYELPGFTGAQALELALERVPGTPFIFVSGVIGEDNAVEMLKRGATDYVSKGRLSRLPGVIQRALREVADRQARERAESRLREVGATYARVVDSLRDYAVILLDVNGCIRDWNRGAREIFRLETTAVNGERADVLFTPEDRLARVFDAELDKARAADRASDDRWMLRADGSRFWAEGSLTPLYTDSGALAGFCKVIHDATATYEHARALGEAKEDAERANRAKDRFLAVLSHELRTPLTPISFAAETLERFASVPPKYQHLLPMIRRNVALEARLIEDLLDLTAISAGKVTLRRAHLDMHRLVHRVVEMVGEQITAKRLNLSLDLCTTGSTVLADEARMQQVLWNVVRNAIKFTPEDGDIRIHTESDGTSFCLHCSDSGIGIEATALPHIFTAFEQADNELSRQFGGLGLGLAIAKGLVLEHEGQLTAYSAGRGRGATFTLTLPCAAGRGDLDDNPIHESQAPAAARTRGGCRLLLVEDNVDAADALALALECYGYQVTHAMSRGEALKAARGGGFDVVVTDLGLPDGSGIDVGRELSAASPVIALSGYGTAQDVLKSTQAGFSGHLVKPADPAMVHHLVQKVLAQRA